MDERVMSCAEAARSHLNELVRDAKMPGIQYLVIVPEQIVFEYAAGWAASLAQFINHESVAPEDMAMRGMAARLGIVKGQPFQPDTA